MECTTPSGQISGREYAHQINNSCHLHKICATNLYGLLVCIAIDAKTFVVVHLFLELAGFAVLQRFT